MITLLTQEQKDQRNQMIAEAEGILNALDQSNYDHKSRYFLNSVKSYFLKHGFITPNQATCVLKYADSVTRSEAESQVPLTRHLYQGQQIDSGDILTLSRILAMKVGLMAGYQKPFSNLEVLEVVKETPFHITVKAQTCFKKSSHCGCCGLKLTDPQSIAFGIGPVCAKGHGMKPGNLNLEELERKLGKKQIEITIYKKHIRNHFKEGPQ